MDRQILVGLSVSIISYFMRYAVKDMSKSLAFAGVVVGIAVMFSSELVPSRLRPPLSVTLWAIAGIVCFGFASHLYAMHLSTAPVEGSSSGTTRKDDLVAQNTMPPASNSIGSINNNQGIVTQGQIG